MAERDDEAQRRRLAALLAQLEQIRMPFGKYGPQRCPPQGAPLYDLPYEYLAWFARRGFPEGELGALLEAVYQLKAAGADAAFDGLRLRAGGRAKLHPPRRRSYHFDDD